MTPVVVGRMSFYNFPIKPASYSLTLREIHKKNKQCLIFHFNFVWNSKCDNLKDKYEQGGLWIVELNSLLKDSNLNLI